VVLYIYREVKIIKDTAATAKPSDAVAIISYDEARHSGDRQHGDGGGRTPMNQTVAGSANA
jgi:hypothetical protein